MRWTAHAPGGNRVLRTGRRDLRRRQSLSPPGPDVAGAPGRACHPPSPRRVTAQETDPVRAIVDAVDIRASRSGPVVTWFGSDVAPVAAEHCVDDLTHVI